MFLAFTVIPFVELWLLLRVGKVLGVGGTLLLVVATGVLGAALAKHQGRQVLTEWRAALAEGRVPEQGVLGGALVLAGGFLLIAPGILTDITGLVLLLPWTRHKLSELVANYLSRQMASGQIHVHSYGFGGPSVGRSRPPPTEVGRGPIRGDVVDTEGEEVP